MALIKKTYNDGESIIYAADMNAMQDEIIANGTNIGQLNTNKQNKIAVSGILKGNGSGVVLSAAAGTDYATPQQVSEKYTKPSGGIPATDMTATVQASLNKADTALQSVPSTYRTASAQDLIDNAQNERIGDLEDDLSEFAALKGSANGLASLDANAKVPMAQLPLTDEISDATKEWLDENVSGGETIAIDKSLTVEGAAADAKAAGDLKSSAANAGEAFRTGFRALVWKKDAEKGISYTTGNEVSSSAFAHTDYILVSPYVRLQYMRVASTGAMATGMAFYNAEYGFVSGVIGIGNRSTNMPVLSYIDVPDEAVYARFTYRKDTETYGDFSVSGMSVINEINNINDAISWKQVSRITDAVNTFGITYQKLSDSQLLMYGTSNNTGVRYGTFLNGYAEERQGSQVPKKTFPPGRYKITYSWAGTITSRNLYRVKSYCNDYVIITSGEEFVADEPFAVAMNYGVSMNVGTLDNPTVLTISVEHYEPINARMLYPTSDTTDRKEDIELMLREYGECKLATGTFFVSGVNMPPHSSLVGSGPSTKIVLLDSVTSGGAIKMGGWCTVSRCSVVGSEDALTFVDGDINDIRLGTRHGIMWQGEATGATSTSSNNTRREGRISDCHIMGFTGGAITCESTGYGCDSGVYVSDCQIRNCGAGINVSWWSEYNRFENVNVFKSYYGVINNGGNNAFSNCNFSTCEFGFYANAMTDKCVIADGTTNTTRNDGHGTVIGCTFNHNGLEQLGHYNNGTAIYYRSADTGFLFIGCQMFYGKVYFRTAPQVMLTDSNCKGITFYLWPYNGTYLISQCWMRSDSIVAYVYDSNDQPYPDSAYNEDGNLQRAKFINCFDASGNKMSLLDAVHNQPETTP